MNYRLQIFLLIIIALLQPAKCQNYPCCASSILVEYRGFSLCYNEKTEQADWVYYYLTPKRVNSVVISRTDDFRPDPAIPTGSATLIDYKGSGYDRGHLCPAGDMRFDSLAMHESFLMSNMSPQFPNFNRGIWKVLEDNVRDWGLFFDTLYVITGPVFYDTTYSIVIGPEKVAVPDAYFKVLLGKCNNEFHAAGFIIPNLDGLKNPQLYAKTIDKVEEVTGFDFFSSIEDTIETKVESRNSSSFY